MFHKYFSGLFKNILYILVKIARPTQVHSGLPPTHTGQNIWRWPWFCATANAGKTTCLVASDFVSQPINLYVNQPLNHSVTSPASQLARATFMTTASPLCCMQPGSCLLLFKGCHSKSGSAQQVRELELQPQPGNCSPLRFCIPHWPHVH
jgi:hypothetical protein